MAKTTKPFYIVECELTANSLTDITTNVQRFNYDRSFADALRPIRPDVLSLLVHDDKNTFGRGSGFTPGRAVQARAFERELYLDGRSGFTCNARLSPSATVSFLNRGEWDFIIKVAGKFNTTSDIQPIAGSWTRTGSFNEWRLSNHIVNTQAGFRFDFVQYSSTSPSPFNVNLVLDTAAVASFMSQQITSATWLRFKWATAQNAGSYWNYLSLSYTNSWDPLYRVGSFTAVDTSVTLCNCAAGDLIVAQTNCLEQWVMASSVGGGNELKIYHAMVARDDMVFPLNQAQAWDFPVNYGPVDITSDSRQLQLAPEVYRAWDSPNITLPNMPPVWSISSDGRFGWDVRTRDLFYGRVQNIHADAAPTLYQEVTIEAVTDIDRLQRAVITTSLMATINAASLFCVIMSESNVRSFAATSVDDNLSYVYFKDIPIANALDALLKSGNYRFFVDGGGTMQLQGRYVGVGATPANSLDSMFALSGNLSTGEIINRAKIYAVPVNVVSDVTTIGFIAAPITLPASGYVGFWLDFVDPILGGAPTSVASAIAQVSSTDYYANTLLDNTGIDLTSTLSLNVQFFGATAVATVFNGGPAGYLSRFQVRGYPAREGTKIGVTVDESSSQALYGVHGFELTNALIKDYTYLDGFARSIVGDRKEPMWNLSVPVINDFERIFGLAVGDNVGIVSSYTGVNSSWFITGTRVEVNVVDGLRHEVTFEAEDWVSKSWLVLDHATMGQLNAGRILGY